MRLVDSIQLEEFTLGSVAPRFSTCKARYTAEKNYLQLELGMDFTTSGMQAVVSS
jgi:Ca2+-dependent lipid-binding protein